MIWWVLWIGSIVLAVGAIGIYMLSRLTRKLLVTEQHHRDVMAEMHFILREVYRQLPVQEGEAGDGIKGAMQIAVTELKGRPDIRANLPLSRRLQT